MSDDSGLLGGRSFVEAISAIFGRSPRGNVTVSRNTTKNDRDVIDLGETVGRITFSVKASSDRTIIVDENMNFDMAEDAEDEELPDGTKRRSRTGVGLGAFSWFDSRRSSDSEFPG